MGAHVSRFSRERTVVLAGLVVAGLASCILSRREIADAEEKPEEKPPLDDRDSAEVSLAATPKHRRKKLKSKKKKRNLTAAELKKMGVYYGKKQRFEKAMEMFLEAQEAYEAENEQHTPGYADLLRELGIWYSMQNRDKEEMARYQEAQAIYEMSCGTPSKEYAGLLKNGHLAPRAWTVH